MPDDAPCTLRLNAQTGRKGEVKNEEPARSNTYNQNFRNRFCGCGENYDVHQEKGTMFQCLGLGTVEDGGCGEDWWHPECLVGYTREEYAKMIAKPKAENGDVTMAYAEKPVPTANAATVSNGIDQSIEPPRAPASIGGAVANVPNGVDGNDIAAGIEEEEDEDSPLPPGFPDEDDFDHFICFKCLAANPWLKQYANTEGFLAPIYNDKAINATEGIDSNTNGNVNGESKKRKASPDQDEDLPSTTLSAPVQIKRQKSEDPSGTLSTIQEDSVILPITPKKQENSNAAPKHTLLPPLPEQAATTPFSLFLKPDFRDHLCHCAACFPLLKAHPQLLEEEETYEPPVSEDGDDGAQSVGTGSLLDRGEAAFNNMDRVRAIQGAMAYAQLKDKVSAFLRPFAESGQAVGAEDVKAYFEKLRGDAQGIAEAAGGAKASREGGDEAGDGADGGSRKEQSGY